MNFTKNEIAKAIAACGDKGDKLFWNDDLTGFGMRVQNGTASWIIQFRIGTTQRRMGLGRVANVELDVAVKLAKQHFGSVAGDVDPSATRTKAKTAASKLFGKHIQEFLDFQAQKRRSAQHIAHQATTLQKRCASLHGLAFDDIEQEAVAGVLKTIAKENGLVAADHARAHLSRFYVWARKDGLCKTNPVVDTHKYADELEPIGREITPAELRAIWHACEDDRYGKIVKLLMLTGKRRTEIGNLKWPEVDLDEAIIHLPGGKAAARVKNRMSDDVPLSKPALAILKSIERVEGQPFVFGGVGAEGFTGWTNAKLDLDKRAGIASWRHHDLRHTVETVLGERFDVPQVHIDAVLNHVSGEGKKGVRKVYNHAKYNKQKRAALDLYADYIIEIVKPTKPKLTLVA